MAIGQYKNKNISFIILDIRLDERYVVIKSPIQINFYVKVLINRAI